MADTTVARIKVITVTSMNVDSRSDDEVKLHLISPLGSILDTINLDKPNHDDREKGQTDEYVKLASKYYKWEDIGFFRLQTYGHNAWLPKAILIELTVFCRESKVAAFVPEWGQRWLSTDENDCNGYAWPSYDIPIVRFDAVTLSSERQPTPSFNEGDPASSRTVNTQPDS
jgi:hypothetical protein